MTGRRSAPSARRRRAIRPSIYRRSWVPSTADDDGVAVRAAFEALTGEALWPDWQMDLYRRLAANELVFQLADLLAEPRALADAADRAGRARGPAGDRGRDPGLADAGRRGAAATAGRCCGPSSTPSSAVSAAPS